MEIRFLDIQKTARLQVLLAATKNYYANTENYPNIGERSVKLGESKRSRATSVTRRPALPALICNAGVR